MKSLLIVGIVVSSLAVIFFSWMILLIMSMANHPGSHQSFIDFGSGLAISLIVLVVCIALLIKSRGVK